MGSFVEPPIVWRIDVHGDGRGYYAMLNPVGLPRLCRIGPPFKSAGIDGLSADLSIAIDMFERHKTPGEAVAALCGSVGALFRCFKQVSDQAEDGSLLKEQGEAAVETLTEFLGRLFCGALEQGDRIADQ